MVKKLSDHPNNHPILVPVDFSPYSEAALIQACVIADCMQLPIVVLHVIHDPAEMPGYYGKINKKKNLSKIEDMAKEMFDEFMREVCNRHSQLKSLQQAKTMMIKGLPVTKILQVITKLNASMVVMGSQGRTGLQHILLGSKAEQIVRLAPVPVTIVKAK